MGASWETPWGFDLGWRSARAKGFRLGLLWATTTGISQASPVYPVPAQSLVSGLPHTPPLRQVKLQIGLSHTAPS